MKKLKKTKTKRTSRMVPGFVALAKLTWLDISSFWRTLSGILLVYACLNFIFVAGFSLFPSSESLEADIVAVLGESAGRAIDSFALVGISLLDISSPSNTALQMVLLIIVSMALIWAVRKLRGLQKITIRQAYYEGPANIIPLILVVTMLLLTLIPASIASTILVYALPIIGSVLEKTIVYIIAGVLVGVSIYWLMVWWPAFYISMLPGTKPVAAMQAAAELTKGRRLKILSRQLVALVMLVVLFVVVVLPLALISQRLVPLIVYTVLVSLLGIGHIVFFNLYRSLIDDQPAGKKKN